jgi:alanine racemase
MFMTTIPRRVWLEIDLGKLISNYRKIRMAVAPAQVLAVLKAYTCSLEDTRWL